jgi:hypothetical protein
MLGDNPEKSKNPLKKAMRRRNAKTVTFTSPTYFEASDVDYSTEEEQGDGEYLEEEEETSRVETQNRQDDIRDEDIVVEPLRPKPHKEKGSREPEMISEDQQSDRLSPEKSRPSDEILDRPSMCNLSPCRSYVGSATTTDPIQRKMSADRGTEHCGIQILSLRMIPQRRRRYP